MKKSFNLTARVFIISLVLLLLFATVEAEAKVAAKHADDLVAAGKVTDAAFGDLTKTKLGQQTLKSADATTDLLAKQSKLVQKWGVKKADEVVSKCALGICYDNRINDLNKVLKAMPENLIDDFSPDRAVKFLGDKKFAEAAEKLTKLCGGAGVATAYFQPTAQTCLTLFTKVDDFEDAVKGAKAVSSYIDDISKIQLPANELPVTLKKLGKIADVDGAKELDGPIKRLTTANAQGAKGIQAEISRASFVKGGGNTGENIAAVSKKVEATMNGEKVSQEVDIISDFTFSGKKTNILEEVKTGEISLGDVDKQFERYGKLLKAGDAVYDGKKIKVSKVRVVVAKGGTITEPAKKFAESNGLEILDWVE